jgi:hypothetical protein
LLFRRRCRRNRLFHERQWPPKAKVGSPSLELDAVRAISRRPHLCFFGRPLAHREIVGNDDAWRDNCGLMHYP